MTRVTKRAAIYARVSKFEPTAENQLVELRRYVEARGWTAHEYIDEGVSAVENRPQALDNLLADAMRRRFEVVICWRLDRLGRDLNYLITLLEDLQTLGVAFVSLAEGIDATTPAVKLQMHIRGAIAEFERARVTERLRAGPPRLRAQSQRLGRPPLDVTKAQIVGAEGPSVRQAEVKFGVSSTDQSSSGALADRNRSAIGATSPVLEPSGAVAAEASVVASPEPRHGVRPAGKRSNPEFKPTSIFLRARTMRLARRKLEDTQVGMDLSDLLEHLLATWAND